MGQDLCTVRRHIRDDISWMADTGTDSLAIGIHEFQLDYKNQHQLDILFEEAERAGLAVHAIPSRWAGLVAGWPPAAGMFAATHPDSWMKKADGTPAFSVVCAGPICSIYDPATLEFFLDTTSRMLDMWPVRGIIWDEIKVLQAEDHSVHAIRALGEPSRGEAQLKNTVKFFSQVNRSAREKKPGLTLSCFVYAFLPDDILAVCATIDELDFFGIDGKCFPLGGSNKKTLFGNFERVVTACRKNDVGTLALIETQNLEASQLQATVEHLPAFLEQPADHLLYYYHGACRDDDEQCMKSMQPVLKEWRHRRERATEGDAKTRAP